VDWYRPFNAYLVYIPDFLAYLIAVAVQVRLQPVCPTVARYQAEQAAHLLPWVNATGSRNNLAAWRDSYVVVRGTLGIGAGIPQPAGPFYGHGLAQFGRYVFPVACR
jgi:hypothetical protein